MTNKQPPWGRIKFGRKPRRSSLSVAIPCGLIIATLFALITARFHPNNNPWWLNVVLYWIMSIPVSVVAIWIAVVDWSTIHGAARNPVSKI